MKRAQLPDQDLQVIQGVLHEEPSVRRVVIFGSRAKGTAKPGSDVDLAVWGADWTTLARLTARLQDQGPLPYFFDLVDYESITSPTLKDHIDRVGIEIYRVMHP